MNVKGRIFYAAKACFYLCFIFVFYFLFLNFFGSFYRISDICVNLSGENMGNVPIQIFYAGDNEQYSEDRSVCYTTSDAEKFTNIGAIELPIDNINHIRIDFGDRVGAKVTLKSVHYRSYYGEFKKSGAEIYQSAESINDVICDTQGDELLLETTGTDPCIDLGKIGIVTYSNHNKLWAAAAALLAALLFNRFVRLKSIYSMASDFWQSKRLIGALAVNDFKTKYAGSYFGIIWAFIQPICTILVFWFVFQIGFRNPNVGDVEYILWFSCGLIPWFFFSDAWNSATASFLDYSYLVKKVVFKINILPMIKILSALFIHLFFIAFLFVLFALYGKYPSVYAFQLIYYLFCMIMLVIGMSFITAPLIIFFKDLGQVMNIVLQFGMWLTPIMWSIDNLPDNLKWIMVFFKLNPMYYIVQGYRDCLIYNTWFYCNIKQTFYFWIVVCLLFIIGSTLYRRLKPHFADVL